MLFRSEALTSIQTTLSRERHNSYEGFSPISGSGYQTSDAPFASYDGHYGGGSDPGAGLHWEKIRDGGGAGGRGGRESNDGSGATGWGGRDYGAAGGRGGRDRNTGAGTGAGSGWDRETYVGGGGPGAWAGRGSNDGSGASSWGGRDRNTGVGTTGAGSGWDRERDVGGGGPGVWGGRSYGGSGVDSYGRRYTPPGGRGGIEQHMQQPPAQLFMGVDKAIDDLDSLLKKK